MVRAVELHRVCYAGTIGLYGGAASALHQVGLAGPGQTRLNPVGPLPCFPVWIRCSFHYAPPPLRSLAQIHVSMPPMGTCARTAGSCHLCHSPPKKTSNSRSRPRLVYREMRLFSCQHWYEHEVKATGSFLLQCARTMHCPAWDVRVPWCALNSTLTMFASVLTIRRALRRFGFLQQVLMVTG